MGLFSEVKIYDTIPDIMRDVNTGRLKAGFADYPILAYNLKQGGFPEVRLVKSYKPSDRRLGRHRRAQERPGAAQEDQRLARQAEGERHGRQDPRQVGPVNGPTQPGALLPHRCRLPHATVEFLPILLQGVELTIIVTIGSLRLSTLLGLVWALMRVSGVRALSAISARV